MKKYHTRKHNVNENYFKSWSQDMAYILGFWFADGVIYNSLFSITQKSDDGYILEIIAKKMCSEYPVAVINKKYSRFYLYSNELVKDIKILGGKERKSLDCEFPNVPMEYLPDFVRGYFDGDGSVSFYRKRNSYYCSFTSGSKMFLSALHDVLKNRILGFRGCLLEKQGSKNKYYTLQMAHNDSIRLRDFMYRSCSDLYLRRKKCIFDNAGSIKILKNEFLSYDDARAIVVAFRIKSRTEWNKFCKMGNKPINIPSTPNRTYKNSGWNSWKDWLGYDKERVKGELACSVV